MRLRLGCGAAAWPACRSGQLQSPTAVGDQGGCCFLSWIASQYRTWAFATLCLPVPAGVRVWMNTVLPNTVQPCLSLEGLG